MELPGKRPNLLDCRRIGGVVFLEMSAAHANRPIRSATPKIDLERLFTFHNDRNGHLRLGRRSLQPDGIESYGFLAPGKGDARLLSKLRWFDRHRLGRLDGP